MTYDLITIGAGISAISAAREFTSNGKSVLMLEKSRGVGGKLCTRRFEDGRFDHGAQYFTVQSKEFKDITEGAVKAQVVNKWFDSHKDLDGTYPRYYAYDGISNFAKYLADGIEVKTQTRVNKIYSEDNIYILETESNEQFRAKKLLLTPPAPQTIDLLSGSNLDGKDYAINELSKIQYSKCLALMLKYESKLSIDLPYYGKKSILWIADNSVKLKSSSECSSLTIHLGPDVSETLFEEDDQDIKNYTFEELVRLYPSVVDSPFKFQVHRWRYAFANQVLGKPFVKINNNCYACGDGFIKSRVEDSCLSGNIAAKQMLSD